MDLTKLTILASAFGVGISFGLQNVVNNFVSGPVVLFDRRVEMGHPGQIGDVSGDLGVTLYESLLDAGIEIPLPQHEVHLWQK